MHNESAHQLAGLDLQPGTAVSLSRPGLIALHCPTPIMTAYYEGAWNGS
jgi:hypothetical protein